MNAPAVGWSSNDEDSSDGAAAVTQSAVAALPSSAVTCGLNELGSPQEAYKLLVTDNADGSDREKPLANSWANRRRSDLSTQMRRTRTDGNTTSRIRIRSSTSPVSTRSPRRAADATTTTWTNVAPRTLPMVSPTSLANDAESGSTTTPSRIRAAGPRWPRHHSDTTGEGTVMRAPTPAAAVMNASIARSRRSIATRAPVSNVIIARVGARSSDEELPVLFAIRRTSEARASRLQAPPP